METKYTPELIQNSLLRFSIPLYQRLFEWEEAQIEQLLKDLKTSFEKDPEQPYYIGMLTAHKNREDKELVDGKENIFTVYDLVDGQQRFTVLTLFAIAMGWDENFLKRGDAMRLSFYARPNDEKYLKQKLNKGNERNGHYINKKMEAGIELIRKFNEIHFSDNTKKDFSDYVFKKLTFFISFLPESYETHDLNKYFEAMNATGRGLENHEILKVNLLRGLVDDSNKEKYTRIWNAISEMDRPLIRKKEKEDTNLFRERQKNALNKINSELEAFYFCNETDKNEIKSTSYLSIKQIEQKLDRPKENFHIAGERAMLTFSEFLLHVLWLQLNKDERATKIDFFNVHKLQETFSILDSVDDVKTFFHNLLKYRLVFDYFIIRISNNELSSSPSYILSYREDSEDIENDKETRQRLIQYQSMLYVSTSTNIWLTEILTFLENESDKITSDGFLAELKRQDDNRHNEKELSLSYGKINRYWFWRLDYYLWENRAQYFKDKHLEIAHRYIFRSNRSIEHIAPQTPQSNSSISIIKEDLDRFGNIAMISSGQNSSLQNESFEVKKAHVHSFINGSKSGTIESLKLLKIYEFNQWNEQLIEQHEFEMLEVIADSFLEDHYIKKELRARIQK